jgi:hypothetical protein
MRTSQPAVRQSDNLGDSMMTRQVAISVTLACFFALPGLAVAQATGVQEGVKVGKVFVSGENPVIRLLDKADGTVLTTASFWRIVWSPVGAGHVCYYTSGDGKSPTDLRIALVDNERLYEYLTNEMLGTYDKSYTERPFTVIKAAFPKSGGDLSKEWRETCKSDKYTVELVWHDFYAPFQVDTPVGGTRNPFGVTSLFIPAKSAQVTVNGKLAAGNVYPQKRGPALSSSAFLAFSETWVK